jgi:hypothetical protein
LSSKFRRDFPTIGNFLQLSSKGWTPVSIRVIRDLFLSPSQAGGNRAQTLINGGVFLKDGVSLPAELV